MVLILLLVSVFSQAAKNSGEERRSSVSQQLFSVFHAIFISFSLPEIWHHVMLHGVEGRV